MTIPGSGFMMENGCSCLPCTPNDERHIVQDLKNKSELHLKEGNLYYLISTRWFRKWEKYVGIDTGELDAQRLDVVPSEATDRPGPIDNSDIIESGSGSGGNELQLRRMLVEGQDYVLGPQDVWEKLYEWYKGGPPLPRKMLLQGIYQNDFVVEVYPLCLKLIDSKDESQSIICLSKKASVRELLEKVCALKGIEQEKARLWDYFNQRKRSQLCASEKTLEESHLQMDQDILLEQVDGYHSSQLGMDSTGNGLALVSLEPTRSSLTIAGGPAMSNGHSSGYRSNLYPGSALGSGFMDTDDGYDAYNSVRKLEKGGLAGLQNLGNTCFMNSAIQCLVHTLPLVDYFLHDYNDEINTKNPLGMHGELALAFGELLRKLWSAGRTAIAPRVFKGKLARFAPQFSGYNQHDSQELLAFLLDGLHEDLNRVKQKPYIEMKDSDGRPDEEVAAECWRNHKARNDSVIVDICQGQYKSTLVCPACGKISITFDPFMYLSLPLPSTITRTMTVTVFSADGSGLPMPFTVSVLKNGYVKDLIQALGSACCLKSDEILLLAEVYESKIYRYLEMPLASLCSIKDDEHIVAFRFHKNTVGKTRLQIFHRCQEKSPSDYLKVGANLFGSPLVTYLGEDQPTGADIDIAVSRVLSPLKRIFSSAKVHGGKENGFLSDGIEEQSNSSGSQSWPRNQALENTASTSSGELSFHLLLTNDKALTSKPLQKDTIFKSVDSISVLIDWTDKEQELYDSSYLKDIPEVFKAGFAAKKTRQEAISLSSCLDAFLMEEPLGPDDMWYCPGCKEHRQAIKKLDLWMLPEIIVFHLKRFTYGRYLKNKIDTFVNFPIHNLDLSKYVKNKDGQSYVYELYAISNHYGGLGGGHYTAYAKLVDEDKWYHFDDSHVDAVSEAEIKTSAAYLLFYKRVKNQPMTGAGEPSESHNSS
ncbi:hypothetical protein SLEP1_g16256 [Rubroshorea leprosula]|uniref:Ubiquitin carboxyl-terminal hydrolase n=1 Tax=Rubroshorea leprosula TaxID=152421 RepID=A0AAV5IQB3_9ROSI|nr:hypothetical protein SLEP1_g16256 [Rubroshorea leprosula]